MSLLQKISPLKTRGARRRPGRSTAFLGGRRRGLVYRWGAWGGLGTSVGPAALTAGWLFRHRCGKRGLGVSERPSNTGAEQHAQGMSTAALWCRERPKRALYNNIFPTGTRCQFLSIKAKIDSAPIPVTMSPWRAIPSLYKGVFMEGTHHGSIRRESGPD